MALTHDERQLSFKTPLGKDFLLLNKFVAHEGISQLFRYELELLHGESESGDEPTIVDPKKILGQAVTVGIEQRDKTKRFWNGIVVRFSQGQRDERFSFYRAEVAPQIWLLTQKTNSRIFQHLSVPDILKQMLAGFDVAFQIQGDFKPRNYCVQYRETDFDFISRLMEEEGIYYFFEHTDGKHKLILGNTTPSHADCPGKSELEFAVETTNRPEDFVGAVETWYVDHNLKTGNYTLWDYHFEMPKKNLEAVQPTVPTFTLGGNDKLEIYDFPGEYAKRFDGVDKGGGERPSDVANISDDNKRTVKIRMQELDAQRIQISGTSDSASLTAGYRFKLNKHPVQEQNALHTLVSVTHTAYQSPTYDTNEPPSIGYANSFECLLHTTPFVPPRVTPKPLVRGSQTAFVVGKAGDEIFTDKYGRVKVQFNWDRESQADASSSCWIRVAQMWAGNRWGTMFIPRVGMEVIVDFIEGDPDQPIIVGSVYNAEAMPPYKLPDEKTKMTMKSDSTTGGGGFNEFRFEDKKGSEQIFIHAQKDVDFRVKNDEREWVGNDHHFIVRRDRREKIERDEQRIIKRDQFEEVERDLHLKIKGKDATEIGGSMSLKVGGAVAEKFGANHSEETSGTIYLKAGATIVLEASAGITLKVGGNFVTINGSGVQIQGSMVMINSGGAALGASAGALVAPKPPAVADPADDDKPGSKMKLEKRSKARQEKTFMGGAGGAGGADGDDKNKDKTHWILIRLIDEAGKPVPSESYKITLPDGSVASGTLDEKGEAKVEGIDPGNCQVTFPDLDKEAWEEG